MQRKLVFSDNTYKKLIKEVKKRECLWNPDDDRYNDRYTIVKAWMEIAEIMELPEDRLRVKWKNLRDLYKKEIKKYGPVDQYTGKWRHFDMMKFLSRPRDEAKDSDDNSIEFKEELNDDDDEEFTFQVEDEHEAEPEGNNEVEVYIDEPYNEDPIPDKRARLTDEDYDLMFLKSLAPYFKQLDHIRKLVVRSKMQDMLLNEIAAQTSAMKFQGKKS